MSEAMRDDILISIVIPVKNGDAWLEKTLGGIFSQTLIKKTEVIAIDSGSTDSSKEILGMYPIRVIEIPAGSFNHGTTRNLGVQAAKGKYVVMTVQDALPASEDWLEWLLAGFEDDTVAGVCGQQVVPHDVNMNPMEWFRPQSPAALIKYHFPDRKRFDALPAEEKKKICSWDNVNAMYRHDYLTITPFRPVEFAEDILWAKEAIETGHALVYQNHARVEHYHHNDYDSHFNRHFAKNYQLYKIFGIVPEPASDGLLDILKNMRWLIKEREISIGDKMKWLRYNKTLRRSARLSDKLFIDTLKKGEAALDKVHEEMSNQKPQALKPEKV